MSLDALILSLPIALDGESVAGSNSTAIAVISAISIFLGYVVLFALWYFVFRAGARKKRKRGPTD